MKILLCIPILITLHAVAQKSTSKLSTEVLMFCDRMNIIHGEVFLDTVYNKCDTIELSKFLSREGVSGNLAVVELLQMKCIDFSFNSISSVLKNIVSKDSFFRMKEREPTYTSYQLIYNKKLDSIVRFINSKRDNNGELPSDVKEIERLLIESSYWNKSMESHRKFKRKLLKILSIFESKEYYFIVYTISEIHSYLHTLPYYELIIK